MIGDGVGKGGVAQIQAVVYTVGQSGEEEAFALEDEYNRPWFRTARSWSSIRQDGNSMKLCEDRLLWGAVLACAAAIYVYPLALPTPLLDPDEGLHATISQEMVERGDYGVPRIQGKPFLDKPILFFAAQALSLRTFGMNEAAARLPGFLFALLGVATTVLLARRLFDPGTGLVVALISLTLPVPFSIAQGAVHDVALVPWTNLLLLCWWEADRGDVPKRRLLLVGAAALCVALALLTKGLIGIAVVSVGYGLFVLLSRQL